MRKPNIKKNLVLAFSSKIPNSILLRIAKVNMIFPYYHIINDQEILHLKHLYRYKNIYQFKDDINFLLKNFTPISIYDLINFFDKSAILPEKAFLLTFDDGFSEMHDIVAPILLDRGIPATFFLNSDFIDNKNLCYLHKASILLDYIRADGLSDCLFNKIKQIFQDNKIRFYDINFNILSIKYKQKLILDEIAQLLNIDFKSYLENQKPYLTCRHVEELIANGFTVGAHSIDHPFYASLSLKDQFYQTQQSIDFINNKFKLNYRVFAFPHGDQKVSKTFFEKIFNDGLIDISFGTSGIAEDTFPRNIQRISFEDPLLPAKDILAHQCARKFYKDMLGKSKIKRENGAEITVL